MRKHGHHLGLIAHIGLHRQGQAASGLDARHHGLSSGGVLGVIDSHGPTLLSGQHSRGRTDAAAATGDQYNGFQRVSPARNVRWGYKRDLGPARARPAHDQKHNTSGEQHAFDH